MKTAIKKIFASFLAVVMVLSSFVLLEGTVNADESETTAYLSFAAADWGDKYWYDGNDYAPVVANNVEVTGYGQYTVSLDFSGVEGGLANGIAFLDVEIANGETAFPNSYMTIDELKINDEVVDLGKTYTSSDDDIATRTNLYNEWVEVVDKGRTSDGDTEGLTAVPVNKGDYPEITTIEVTFTLGDGVAFGDTESEDATQVDMEFPEEGLTAYIAMADNAWAIQHWFDGNDYSPVVANYAMVTGYGQYSVSLDFTGVEGGVCPDIVFMDVEIKDGEIFFPNSYMQIDSMMINGQAVELGNTYTSSDNDLDTRTNLFNQWVETVENGRTNGLDLSEVTAVPLAGADYVDIETVEVTFTLIEGEPVVEEVAEEEYVMPTEFNAFMMFSDTSGAWETYAPGVSGDTTVIGDGKYSVYVNASDIGATGQAEEGQVFLVDIEELGRAMVELGTLREADDGTLTDTDAEVTVEVFIDGEKVTSKSKNILIGDLEDNGRLRLEFYNVWGSGTQDNPVVMPAFLNPADEIRVDFTLVGTGLNTGAVIEEEPAAETDQEATDTQADTDEITDTSDTTDTTADDEVVDDANDGLSTGGIVGIIVGLVAVIAGGTYFVKKKK